MRLLFRPALQPLRRVSIHALRGECDDVDGANAERSRAFQSTHSGGNATTCTRIGEHPRMFQSTHSGGNATIAKAGRWIICKRFNPRTPGGMRRKLWICDTVVTDCFNPRTPGGMRHTVAIQNPSQPLVSIHALRGECDCNRIPLRYYLQVSIHALRGECDPYI